MDEERRDDALEHFRNGYLQLKSALHDRITGLPAYPLLVGDLRALLDGRRQIGVVHVEPADLGWVESLYGWQEFDRTIALLGRALRELPGGELPGGALLAVVSVPADRFVVFFPDGRDGREITPDDLAAWGASIKLHLEAALDDDPAGPPSSRIRVRTGHALLSENPFYRFERRLHAAVEEARRLPERRAARRDRVWGAELKRFIRESRVRTVWQPVVDLDSGSVVGFEALSRGPADSMFEMPRAMFALSDRVGASGDLDRLCRAAAIRGAAEVAGSGKLFVNVLPATLHDEEWRTGAVPELLLAAGRRPADVVVEISERALGAQAESFAPACEALRSQGFGLAVDDAGTGRDGAATLRHLRPDYVKVDASVVRGVEASLLKQEIFSTLVGLGEAVGAAVVAVGVESADEAATLRRLGARYGQGYHFAGPAPRERWAS
jgi:EAL domain-containing protein (putative c-di-GMP-specific phosphodiesterase class I)